MFVALGGALSAALERLKGAARWRSRLVPLLWGGLTSACTRPAIRCLSCFSKGACGRVMRGVRSAESDGLRAQAFHPVALGRSNISFNATRDSVAFIIFPRSVDRMPFARAR